jgi:hypothetical protein
VNRWRPEANNKEWASVTKEAMLLGGPQSQGAIKFYDFIIIVTKLGITYNNTEYSFFIRCL